MATDPISILMSMRHPISTLRRIYGNVEINKLTADRLNESFAKYREYVGLQPNGIFNDKAKLAFKDLVTQNPQGTAVFEKSKTPDGKDMYALLKADTKEAKAIDQEIQKAFLKKPAFNAAEKRYTEAVSKFETICKKIPQQCSAHGLMNNIAVLIEDSKIAIHAQHEAELQELETLFTNNNATLKTVFSIDTSDTTTIDKFKKIMLADLEAVQKKQYDDFTKQAEEATLKLGKAVEKQSQEIALLGKMLQNDKTGMLREEIKRVMENKAASNPHIPATPAAVSLKGHTKDANRIDISGISIDDLEFTVACHGAKITKTPTNTVDKDGNPEYTYSVDLPRILFSPLRYGSPVDKTTAILETLALQIKAKGYEGIELNVDFNNDSLQKTRNQQAYRACILAGFPPDKIVIKNHGNEVKADAIFAPNELSHLHQESTNIQQKRNQPLVNASVKASNIKQLDKKSLQNVKDDLNELKKDKNYLEAQKVIDGTTPPSP